MKKKKLLSCGFVRFVKLFLVFFNISGFSPSCDMVLFCLVEENKQNLTFLVSKILSHNSFHFFVASYFHSTPPVSQRHLSTAYFVFSKVSKKSKI